MAALLPGPSQANRLVVTARPAGEGPAEFAAYRDALTLFR